MDEIIEDIAIANLQINDTIQIDNFIQPEYKNTINIGNKLNGSFILSNIQIGFDNINLNTYTIINATSSQFLTQLNNTSYITIYYNYRTNQNDTNIKTSSFYTKVKYIIDDYLIILQDIFDTINYHQYKNIILSKTNLSNNNFLQVEIVPDITIYNLNQNQNYSIINIFNFKPIDVQIYLPDIPTDQNIQYEIIITNPLKSLNIITNQNAFLTGSFLLNSQNLYYQSIQQDQNIQPKDKYISKSILITSNNNYNNKSQNFYINNPDYGLLSGNLKIFSIDNFTWNIQGHLLGNINFINKTPQVLTNIYGFQNQQGTLDLSLNTTFNINNNLLSFIDSNDQLHQKFLNNFTKIYYNNQQTNILLNKYIKYNISFKFDNQINNNIYLKLFYLKINNKYHIVNEINKIHSNIYLNNILDLSYIHNYNQIYFVITKSNSINTILNDTDTNIITQGTINLIDSDQSFYIQNIKDKNDQINNKLLYPNPYYNTFNPFLSLNNITYNTHINNNLNNIYSELENSGKGFYKIRNSDNSKYFPLFFLQSNANINSSDSLSSAYGPYSNNQFIWKNHELVNYYMPDNPINSFKYNPFYTNSNNINQYYLPDTTNLNPDTVIIDTLNDSAIGSDFINITWKTFQNDLELRNNIKNYIIQSYIDNNWITIATLNSTNYNYTNLLNNTQYKIRISAVNQLGYVGNYSLVSTYTTKISTTLNILPNTIKNLQTTTNNNTIVLTWEPPLDNNSGTIIGYNIDIYQSDKWINIASLVTDLFYRITNLIPNTFYKFRINATNNSGSSNYITTDSSLKTTS